jgi:hypothetical protein
MGDISMRGKGRALKMKEGGRASRDLKAIGPKLKGRIKKRTDGAMKRRAEEASMRELRYPTSKPKRRRPERPERDREFKPMPMPMPRPEKPKITPMPKRMPKVPKDIEKYFMKTPRRVTPLKDGGSAKKPDSARGKSTRIGKIKKIVENMKERGNVGRPSMSPGKQKAIFGTTNQKVSGPRDGLRRKQVSLQKLFAGSTLKGAGKMGVGMAGQVMKAAKKLKPKGRINVDDLKKVKQMIMKRKGK